MISLPHFSGIFKACPIGLDLAFENLHMLQFEKNQNGDIRIRAGTSTPYPHGRAALVQSKQKFRSFIRQALSQKPFKGKKVTSYLPGSICQLMHMDYDVSPNTNIDETIANGVIKRFGGNFDDFVIDYLQVRTDESQAENRRAMVAVARKKEVLSYIELLEHSGLDVDCLEIGPLALRRLAASLDTEKRFPSLLLINFGRVSSYLTVLSGKRLLMDREVDFGENQLVETMSKSLDLDKKQALDLLYNYGMGSELKSRTTDNPEQQEIHETTKQILKPIFFELVENINKALVFMASETRGQTVEEVYLLGSVARYPGADTFIADMISIPVKLLHPLKHFALASKDAIQEEVDPVVSIAMAAGLALRGT